MQSHNTRRCLDLELDREGGCLGVCQMAMVLASTNPNTLLCFCDCHELGAQFLCVHCLLSLCLPAFDSGCHNIFCCMHDWQAKLGGYGAHNAGLKRSAIPMTACMQVINFSWAVLTLPDAGQLRVSCHVCYEHLAVMTRSFADLLATGSTVPVLVQMNGHNAMQCIHRCRTIGYSASLLQTSAQQLHVHTCS